MRHIIASRATLQAEISRPNTFCYDLWKGTQIRRNWHRQLVSLSE